MPGTIVPGTGTPVRRGATATAATIRRMGEAEREKWNERHRAAPDSEPDPFVRDALALALALDVPRTMLDVACGRGRHLSLFARAGFDALGVDVSDVAVAHVNADCSRQGLRCRALRHDLDDASLPPGPFGVVLVSHFLDRALWPALREATAPGGLLVVRTFAAEHARRTGFRADLCLREGELLGALAGFHVLLHRVDDEPQRVLEGVVARR